MKKCVLIVALLFLFASYVSADTDRWSKYDSRHFIIYYKNAPLNFVKNVSETAEEYYDEIPRNLGFIRYQGWTYENRAVIYIYDDQDEYRIHAKNMEWSGGMANVLQKEIRTFPAAAGFFDSTLPHELAHLIFREFIGNSHIPLWLDEGVAMYQEKAKRWGANKVVKDAIKRGKFIPLSELTAHRLSREKTEEIINIFYAEAASIVYYMIVELGESRFENFCRKLSAGISFEEALQKNYGRFRNMEDLNNRWVDYLKSQ
ncbi:MAG: hypothetical protein H6754_05805 [Candidatus Omnitrophica bacterium]|nr:hypothetical protein [Candidatus Omnitrophota bacterium]